MEKGVVCDLNGGWASCTVGQKAHPKTTPDWPYLSSMLQLRQRLRELRLRHFLTTSITVSLLSSEMCRRSRTFKFRSYNRKKKKEQIKNKYKLIICPDFIHFFLSERAQTKKVHRVSR